MYAPIRGYYIDGYEPKIIGYKPTLLMILWTFDQLQAEIANHLGAAIPSKKNLKKLQAEIANHLGAAIPSKKNLKKYQAEITDSNSVLFEEYY